MVPKPKENKIEENYAFAFMESCGFLSIDRYVFTLIVKIHMKYSLYLVYLNLNFPHY